MLTQSSRWKLDEMREDAKRRGVTPSDERTAREHYLIKGVEAPDLAAVKDFLRFQASVMRGKIKQTLGDRRQDFTIIDMIRQNAGAIIVLRRVDKLLSNSAPFCYGLAMTRAKVSIR